MLRAVIPFRHAARAMRSSGAVQSFVSFVEKRLHAEFVYSPEQFIFGNPMLSDAHALAHTLQNAGVIRGYHRSYSLPDEPRYVTWSSVCASSRQTGGGLAALDEKTALMASLAEALERYLWSETDDYFRASHRGAAASLPNGLPLDRLAGFSNDARAKNTRLVLAPDSQFLWTKGHSWTSDTPIFVPAQLVSAKHFRAARRDASEPILRMPITNGLATWPTREGAVLGGILELIERDAFMIMWLNKLTLPRVDWSRLRHHSALDHLLRACTRYRLRAHCIQLITDAPAHAVCVVLEDTTGHAPRITIGLKAGAYLPHAAESALLEALRARRLARTRDTKQWNRTTKADEVRHHDRVRYWMEDNRSEELAFMYAGPMTEASTNDWGSDKAAHLEAILTWCREKKYECASVPLGISRRNPTSFHVEMVVIPELQPMHVDEPYAYLAGERLREIPAQFGYAPRATPFLEPHPFL